MDLLEVIEKRQADSRNLGRSPAEGLSSGDHLMLVMSGSRSASSSVDIANDQERLGIRHNRFGSRLSRF